jgi:hypothetical protein
MCFGYIKSKNPEKCQVNSRETAETKSITRALVLVAGTIFLGLNFISK